MRVSMDAAMNTPICPALKTDFAYLVGPLSAARAQKPSGTWRGFDGASQKFAAFRPVLRVLGASYSSTE
jgi:hypothetical protein